MLNGQHVLLCVIDKNEFLSDSSKEALAAACKVAKDHSSKMSVYVSDVGGGARSVETVRWHLRDQGVEEYQLHEDETRPNCVAAALSDVADECNADLVVISSAAVHAKHVDANLLAEFCPCPLVMVP